MVKNNPQSFNSRARYALLSKQIKNRFRLHVCHTIGHKVMPSIAIWFVISYWVTGYTHILEIDQTINIILLVIFTVIWFGTIILLNAFWEKIKSLVSQDEEEFKLEELQKNTPEKDQDFQQSTLPEYFQGL